MEENNNLNDEPKVEETERKYNNYENPKRSVTISLSTLVLLVVITVLTVIVVLLGIRTNDQHKEISRLKEQLPGSRTYRDIRDHGEFRDYNPFVEDDGSLYNEDDDDYEDDMPIEDIDDYNDEDDDWEYGPEKYGLTPIDEYLEPDTSNYSKDVSKFDLNTIKEFTAKAVRLDKAASDCTKEALTMLNLLKPEEYDRILKGKSIDENKYYYATNIDYKDFLKAINEYMTGIYVYNSLDLSCFYVNQDGKLCFEDWGEEPHNIEFLSFEIAKDDEDYEDEDFDEEDEDPEDRLLNPSEYVVYIARIKDTYGTAEYTDDFNIELTVKDGKLLLNDWY